MFQEPISDWIAPYASNDKQLPPLPLSPANENTTKKRGIFSRKKDTTKLERSSEDHSESSTLVGDQSSIGAASELCEIDGVPVKVNSNGSTWNLFKPRPKLFPVEDQENRNAAMIPKLKTKKSFGLLVKKTLQSSRSTSDLKRSLANRVVNVPPPLPLMPHTIKNTVILTKTPTPTNTNRRPSYVLTPIDPNEHVESIQDIPYIVEPIYFTFTPREPGIPDTDIVDIGSMVGDNIMDTGKHRSMRFSVSGVMIELDPELGVTDNPKAQQADDELATILMGEATDTPATLLSPMPPCRLAININFSKNYVRGESFLEMEGADDESFLDMGDDSDSDSNLDA